MVSEIVFIETPVTDYLYDGNKINQDLAEKFFRFLDPSQPPRPGDNYPTSKEVLDQKLLSFAEQQGIPVNEVPEDQRSMFVREYIFGKPVIEAGGAIANSFDAVVKAAVNDIPLVNGVFVTALGEGISGKVFADSLPGRLIHPAPQGWQMEALVFPVGGDRIMFSVPSFANPPSDFMSASQLDEAGIGAGTRMIALGGYMKYTGKFNEFFDAVLEKVKAVSTEPEKRPMIVLTAASQNIAESSDLRNAVARASEVAPVTVFANTGEFRRLMDMDTEWRKPHEHKWQVGEKKLEGNDLETAKWNDREYIADKLAANDAAYWAAYKRYGNKGLPVTFVVTNGKRGVYVVDANGISENYLPPKPPHGVVNTVGGGDGFAGGYMLGMLRGLPQQDCVSLGFICAGEIIGRDQARLPAKSLAHDLDGENISAQGLPAYLDPQNPTHKALLKKLAEGTYPTTAPALKRPANQQVARL